jgi:hypothetical protein
MNSYNDISEIKRDILYINQPNFIIVTGGVGDFLTLDYFFSFGNTKNIIFISNQSLKLKHLFNFYYPEKKHYSLYFNFSLINKPGFNSTDELLSFFPELHDIRVVNISEYFPLIRTSYLIVMTNTIISKIIKKDIKHIYRIPDNFALISPYTQDINIHCIKCNILHSHLSKCGLSRNFVCRDYTNIFDFLKEKKITGVIISIIPINIPDKYKDFDIINLSHSKIDIIDCIEIVKQCGYFFGIDSFLSVIASKILPQNNIYIKCNNLHGLINKDVYWFPNKNINLQRFIDIKY